MTYLLKFVEAHQVLFASIIGIMGFGLNMIYTSFYNHQVDSKLTNIQNQTIHARIDAYSTGMAHFRDAAYKIELHDNDLQSKYEQLVGCVKRKDCEKYSHLLVVPDKANVDVMKSYDVVKEALSKINQQMD